VALIVYMAHVGSFVPAASATVGLCDRILTRILSQEQLALHQSSFCADLAQVGLRNPARASA
jgi:DNA mismatch repair protein MSH5